MRLSRVMWRTSRNVLDPRTVCSLGRSAYYAALIEILRRTNSVDSMAGSKERELPPNRMEVNSGKSAYHSHSRDSPSNTAWVQSRNEYQPQEKDASFGKSIHHHRFSNTLISCKEPRTKLSPHSFSFPMLTVSKDGLFSMTHVAYDKKEEFQMARCSTTGQSFR